MKYETRIFVEAEQFLPIKNQIPKGVMSDGPRSPKSDPRAAYIVKTEDGTTYMRDGDYVVTRENGARYVVERKEFERTYKESKEG
jgi:hypothetical protein